MYGGPIGCAMRLFLRDDLYASISTFYATVANINALVANIDATVAYIHVTVSIFYPRAVVHKRVHKPLL